MPTIRNALFAICLSILPVAAAQSSIEAVAIDGNEASASLELPGGIGAELTIRFESAVGLSADSLGLSVGLVDPLSPQLPAALPAGSVSIPSGFPVLLTIAAPADGGLSFEGLVEIELYTRNLAYSSGTTLRLYSSSNGQPFRDITDTVSGGSYRVRGSSGQFSDFLIVADDRPLAEIVESNFGRLNDLLSTHAAAIDAGVLNQLDLLLDSAYAYWQIGDPGAAVEQVRLFAAAVRTAAAAGQVPDVWRSSRDLDNVAGLLRADARVLRFALGLALAGTP